MVGVHHEWHSEHYVVSYAGDMTVTSEEMVRTELVAPSNGRVVIPAQLRRAAHIEPGDELVMYAEDERVVIETRQQLAARIKRDIADGDTGTGSPVEQLVSERRAEAARETTE